MAPVANDERHRKRSNEQKTGSGENFEPDGTVPVPAGGFVRRVAHTPHYDGVKKGGKEPAVVGIFGQAPIEFKLTDPTKPPIREV
jgi:hypothetical protein